MKLPKAGRLPIGPSATGPFFQYYVPTNVKMLESETRRAKYTLFRPSHPVRRRQALAGRLLQHQAEDAFEKTHTRQCRDAGKNPRLSRSLYTHEVQLGRGGATAAGSSSAWRLHRHGAERRRACGAAKHLRGGGKGSKAGAGAARRWGRV